MGIKTLLAVFLLFCTAQKYCASAAAVSTKLYDLSHLFKPQLDFEINLIVADTNFYSAVYLEYLPLALTQSMDYVVSKQVPFRLYYNFTQEFHPPPRNRSARHAQNRIAYFVFFAVQSKTPEIDLNEVVESCLFSNFAGSSTVQKGFVHLIVDESAMKEPWGRRFVHTIFHWSVPLYFNIFYWTSPWFASGHADLVREKCECDDPVLSPQKNIFDIINEENGMERLAERIRTDKKNFGGRKVIMCWGYGGEVNVQYNLRWHANPFIFRSAHSHPVFAIRGVLHAFSTAHNVSFEVVDCPVTGLPPGRGHESYIYMLGTHHPGKDDSYQPPLSLHKFDFCRTLTFSKPTQSDPFTLSSLAAPFHLDHTGAIAVLGSSICTTLVLIALMADKSGTDEAFLAVFSGLVGKSLLSTANKRALR